MVGGWGAIRVVVNIGVANRLKRVWVQVLYGDDCKI